MVNDRELSAAGIARITAVAQEHVDDEWHEAAQVAVYRDGEL